MYKGKSSGIQGAEDLLRAVDHAIYRAQEYLLGIQYPEGYWWGELESNPTMEAEYLLLSYFLGVVNEERWRKLCRSILERQREDGSWGQYYQAPGDLSTSVECYFALKLAGIPPDHPALERARGFILSKGGVPRVRVFTKIWLALFGQWDWRDVPFLPPELVLLPTWFPINIYEFASWARATIVPLTIVLAKRPVCPVPPWARVPELFPEGWEGVTRGSRLPGLKAWWGWRGFFSMLERALRLYEGLPWKPGRVQALRKAEEWIVLHQEADGSWGGIQPPWVYSLIALKTLGYPMHHPVMKKGFEGFEGFAIEDRETWRVQACVSPVWDTCLALIALLDSGMAPHHPALQKAGRWLLERQVRTGGDWQVKVKGVEPGGWAFEFFNDRYPDVDDTAEVLMALNRVELPQREEKERAIERGVKWLLAMQSRNGGWASFDKDNTRTFIAQIPFCDFGETIDPPSEDVTAHVVELLGCLGYTRDFPPVRRALEYLKREQEAEGCWFGRWGVNYIYGTGAVLPALKAVGEDMEQPYVRRAVDWLLAHQNPDGGWGESCASYVDPALWGRGPSTPSQTAWALLALLAAGEVHHPATERGVRYLVESQQDNGSWDEPYFTGTGFPGYGVGRRLPRPSALERAAREGPELSAGFMINYHLYRHYWPLMALGRYRRLA